MNDKQLYEFINMSDKITFYAINDDIARAVALLLGGGKCGAQTISGRQVTHTFTAFGNTAPDEIYIQIEDFVKTGNQDLVNSLNSVACCDFNERKIYDEFTENSTNEEQWLKWDNTHRTSINNYGSYSRKLANKLQEKQTENSELLESE